MFDFIRYIRGISALTQISDVRVLALIRDRADNVTGLKLIAITNKAMTVREKVMSRVLLDNVFDLGIVDYIQMYTDYKPEYHWSCFEAVKVQKIAECPEMPRIKDTWHNGGLFLSCAPEYWNFVPVLGQDYKVGCFNDGSIRRVSLVLVQINEVVLNLHKMYIHYNSNLVRVQNQGYRKACIMAQGIVPGETSAVLCEQYDEKITEISAYEPLVFDINVHDCMPSCEGPRSSTSEELEYQLMREDAGLKKPVGNVNKMKSFDSLKDMMSP